MNTIVHLLNAEGLFADVRDLLNEENACYTEPLPKLLMATAGTMEQSRHYDYTIKKLPPARQSPMSAVVALHGDMTHITLDIDYKDVVVGKSTTHHIHRLIVPLNPGDMVIWAGHIAHAGGAYARDNVRLFAYFPTKAYEPNDSLTFLSYMNTKTDKYIFATS
jgi:hypothetical protein